MNRRLVFAGLLVGAAACLGACKPPKYVRYVSPFRDFTCEVPWGWSVFLDSAGQDYVNVTFTGPREPLFYKGLPSLSVRWYRHNAPHWLPDGKVEQYSGHQDFVRQMLRDVYGPDGYVKGGSDFEQQLAASKGFALTDFSTVKASGLPAYYYVAYRTVPAPKGAVMGVVMDEGGNAAIRQRHGYIFAPRADGFYAMVYPATREGYEQYRPAFFHMVNTFKVLTEGPGGRPASPIPAAPLSGS